MFIPSRSDAVCPTDLDGDGYGTGSPPPPGCPMVPDCDDGDPAISPNAFETLHDQIDQNCNGVDALRVFFSEAAFPAASWPSIDVGPVSWGPDGVTVNPGATGNPAAIRRVMNMAHFAGGTGVMLDVDAATGTGCTVQLTTAPLGGGPSTTSPPTGIPGSGTRWLTFPTVTTPYALKAITVRCPAGNSVTLDWLSVQDADAAFPPPWDLSIDWKDIRAPAGGFTTTVVRDDAVAAAYMGTDVAGIARRFPAAAGNWSVANGTGLLSLYRGGIVGISDILPMEDGGGDLYALVGDVDWDGAHGGLWYSPDNGDTWTVLGTSWDDASYTAGIPENDTDDDVAGYPLETNCKGTHFGRTWEEGGGRHLQGDHPAPVFGDIVYIANADEDALGVSIWDGSAVCKLPNSGAPLPADRVGAILRVDVKPNDSPVLVVGYRGRVDYDSALYVCDLPPGGPSCGLGGATADCWEVAIATGGLDVRDLEASAVGEAGVDDDESRIFVADGGNRPEDSNGDGIGDVLKYDTDGDGVDDAACIAEDSGLDVLVLDDALGFVAATAYDRVADDVDMPELANFSLTGIGIDLYGSTMIANVPVPRGSDYERDRAYRADVASVLSGTATWQALNSGVPTAYNLEDPCEAVRHNVDSDYRGAWWEAINNGNPAPYPGRFTPGTAADTVWLRETPLVDQAMMSGGNNAWMVHNLASAWTDDPCDPDGDDDAEGEVTFEFAPDIEASGHRTYQTTVVHEVAIDPQGQIYSAAGDIGLMQMDGTEVFDPAIPNGAQVDCLWNGWHAGAQSVDVGLDGSVWVALLDQDVNDGSPYAHNMGVLRTLDQGTTWEYAAAGYYNNTKSKFEMSVYDPGGDDERVCIDETTHAPLGATPFEDAWGTSAAHAFSTEYGNPPFETYTDTVASFGNPKLVRALDQTVAIVLFSPYQESGGTWMTEGGLYLTLDGGVTWQEVPFDGQVYADLDGIAGDDECDIHKTWQHGNFEIIHKGADSYWLADPTTGAVDSFDLELVYSVTLGNNAPVIFGSSPKEYPCAVAKVSITGDPSTVSATWNWVPLTEYNDDDFDGVGVDDPGACGVSGLNLARIAIADWADEALIWGDYKRTWEPSAPTQIGNRQGGVCTLNLDTAETKLMVNPTQYEFSIGYVAPHPDVADVYAVLPLLDMGTWGHCYRQRDASDPLQARCPDFPWPMIARKDNTGAFSLRVLDTMAPTSRPYFAIWSHIDTPDDSETGEGSYLMMASSGSGSWRGEITW